MEKLGDSRRILQGSRHRKTVGTGGDRGPITPGKGYQPQAQIETVRHLSAGALMVNTW